jgi:virginiamycin B lyase
LVEFERKSGGAPWDIAYAYGGGEEGMVWFSEEVGNRICRIDDTVAKTTITVTSRYTIATQSSTATTLGSEMTKKWDQPEKNPLPQDPKPSYPPYSSTTYRVTETSSFLRTSYVAEFTSTAFFTGTTTVTATSYVTTVYTTTSITATTTSVETSMTSVTATSTMTSYIATLTATGTVTSISTVTVTSYEYATTGPGPPIPGYSPSSILMGLALGSIALIALRLGFGGRRTRNTLRRGRWLAALLSSLLILVVALSPATRAALVTEWSLPPGSTIPNGIAFDDQSPYRVWFAEFGSDRIGRLDHVSGEIYEIILPATSQPWGVAFESARDELWFTMSGRHRLGCISGYGTSIYELELEPDSGPRGLAVQEHVNGTNYPYIWIALYGKDKIARVDPYSAGKVVYWPLASGANPQSIIFVPDTGVWFTEDGLGRIGNLNPATGEVKEWTLPDEGKAWALAGDAYGFIWFTDYANSRIGRLNPYTGEIILYWTPTSNSQPYGIAVDSTGNVWFAEHAQNRIGRFSPDSLTFEEFAKPTGGSAWGLAISQDGKIWFTDDSGNKICRLDPYQALVTTTISEISTASKSTNTVAPASMTKNPATVDTTRHDVATTRMTAPTTLTTTYGLTETVKVLRTSTTTSNTSYIPSTLTVLGDLTLTVTNTISTHVVTVTTPYTSTLHTYTTRTETFTTTKYNTVTVTTTSPTTVTTAFGFGMIPGYSTASILTGLIIGAASLTALNLRRLRRR